MKFKVFKSDGSEDDEGTVGVDVIDIPTHGSLSVEIYPGIWMNILVSEWCGVDIDDRPMTWKTDKDRSWQAPVMPKDF